MALSFTKRVLSGSTNGQPISVTAVGATGNIVHTTASQTDEIWLWAMNTATYTARLTVEWGGTATTNSIAYDIPAAGAGPVQIVPGWSLTATLVARVYATVASVLTINGYVNRISVT